MRADIDSKTLETLKRLILGALVLGLPLTAAAETPAAGPAETEAGSPDAASPDAASPDAASPDRRPTAGLRVYLDPETGEITDRPAAEQVEKLSAALDTALRRDAEDLEPFALTGGGHGVFLAGRFRSATLLRRHADGTFDVRCVDSAAEAAAFLARTAGTAPPPHGPALHGVEIVWEEK